MPARGVLVSSMQRSQVFISYSHADAEYLGRLKVHIRPFERQGQVDLWADSRIMPGDRWKHEIRAAMERASIAVLLVSADFLASDFVAENELPPLLEAAQRDGVRIIPVILKPCAFTDIPSLAQFHSVNDPRRPLASLTESDREQIWYDLVATIRKQMQGVALTSTKESSVARASASPLVGLDIGSGLFNEEFVNPEMIADFFVYQYHHIDGPSIMPLASDVLSRHPRYSEVIERIKARLVDAGWEGDGEVRLMWFPPFLGAGVQDTYGVGAWFVKQRNNGTAWIASPVPLPFERLHEQQ
jgi:hypothetical protein